MSQVPRANGYSALRPEGSRGRKPNWLFAVRLLMRNLSPAIQALLSQPTVTAVHLLSFTVGATAYYFGEDLVVFQGNTYLPHLLDDFAVTYNQTLQSKPVTVKLQNISLDMAAVLKAQQSNMQGVEVLLLRFFPAVNDFIVLFDGVITAVQIDEQSVMLTMDYDLDPTASQIPARQYSQLCGWNFKDSNCGYTDGVDPNDPSTGLPFTSCPKDFLSCQARGRQQRFPGFIHITADLTQLIQGQAPPNVVQPQPLSSVLTTPWETP